MSEREMFEAWHRSTFLEEPNNNDERWFVWQAAIASVSQQAAQPKAAMTDEQIIAIRAAVGDRYNSAWHLSDSAACEFARAIEAASGPNAVLVEALKGCTDIMLSNGIEDCDEYRSASAALASVPPIPETK